MNRHSVLGLSVDLMSYEEVVDRIMQMAQIRESSYICVANVHMLIEAIYSGEFQKTLNDANLVVTDGTPLTWSVKLLYDIQQDRIAGMDLLPDLLRLSEQKNLGIFLYGGTAEMLRRTGKYFADNFPDLEAHFYDPPFRPLSVCEENEMVERINATGAHLVFVVLGCPKQEKWMASMKGRINACMIGIGGALPVMIGMQKRAPQWMQKAGLEWLFRLCLEPRRLFKRYAVTNTIFCWLLFKAWVKQGCRPVKLNMNP